MQGKLKRRLRMLCAAVTSAALMLCVVGGWSTAMADLGKPTATIGERSFVFDGEAHYTVVTPPSDEYEVYYSSSKLTVTNAKENGSKEPVTRTEAGKTNVYYAVIPVNETPTSANSVASYFALQVTKGLMANVTVAPIPDQPLVTGGAKPELTVTDPSGYELTLGKDYTVKWTNNTKVGTAKVSIAGYNNYSGSVTATFNISSDMHSTVGAVPAYVWAGSGSEASGWTCTAQLPCTTVGHTDTVEVQGVVTRTSYVAPTCTEGGSACFEATFGEDWATTQMYLVELPAAGHNFNHAEFAWNGLESAEATFTCSGCGITETVPAEISSVVKTEPNCLADGWHTYYATATSSSGVLSADSKDVQDIPSAGHNYSEAAFTWNGTESCEVVFTDPGCGATETKTATITNAVTTEPTCTADGVRTYTATAESSTGVVRTDTVTETITSEGHNYSVLVSDRVEATCTEDGHEAIYKCSGCDETIGGEPIEATGHAYAVNSWSWTGTTKATADLVCSGCGNHVYVVGTINAQEPVEATCVDKGSTSYKAIAEYDGQSYEDTKVIETAALGHAYGDAIWVWTEDGKSATASVTCERCGNTENKAATISTKTTATATCTELGERTCSAQARFDTLRYYDTKVVEIPALGHTYTKTENWAADGKSADVNLSCSTCGTVRDYSLTVGETTFTYDGLAHPVTITSDNAAFKVYYSTSKLYPETAAVTGSEEPVSVTEVGKDYVYYAVVPVDEAPTSKNSITGSITAQVSKPGISTVTIAPIPDQPYLVGGVEPELDLTNSEGYKLVKGVDYTVQWTNNDKLGTATAKINGFNNYSGSVTTTFTVSRDVHYFEGVEYTWSGEGVDPSNWTCTATHPCVAIDHTDALTPSVTATTAEYTAPTCTEDGSITIKASFAEEWAEDQYKTLVVPALGHTFTHATFEWTGTESAVATFTCDRCDVTEEVADVQISDRVSIEPTCTTDGERTYTATATSSSGILSAGEKKVTIPASGHNYYEVGEWTWSEDNSSATVKFTCPGCGDVEVVDADVSSEVTTPATCTVKGWTTYTATATSKTGTPATDTVTKQDVATIAHDYAAVVTEPTCTEQGYTTHTCKVCGDSYVDSYVEQTGHAYNSASFVWAEDGKTATVTFTCDNGCGVDDVHENVVATSEVTTPATCTAVGTTTYTVTVTSSTGKVATESTTRDDVIALGHDYNAVVTAPTCTELGYTTHTCSRCGDSYVDTYVDALGHSYGAASWNWTGTSAAKATFTCETCGDEVVRDADITSEVTTEATCTEKGVKTFTAKVSFEGTEYTDSTDADIAALGHDLVHHDAQAATCTGSGWDAYDTCSRCDYSTYAEIAALGHDYNAVVTAPTCTEQGYTTHTCTRCADSYVDSYVDATGHSYVDTVTAPTCTSAGYTTHVCSVCNDTYVDSETAATGHDYSAPVWLWAEDGKSATVSFTCANCSDVQTPAVSVDEGVVTTDPTCTAKGWTTYTAAATDPSGATVNDTKAVQDVAMLPHAFNSAVFEWHGTESCTFTFLCADCTATEVVEDTEIEVAVKQDATCTVNGIHTYTASAVSSSGFEKKDVREIADIAALGHDYSVLTSAKLEPTCTEDGHEAAYKCSRCDATSGGETINKLGHSYSFNEETGWTWAEDGKSATATFVCETCGDTQVVDAAVSSSKLSSATCTENGTTKYTAVAEFEGDSYNTTTTRDDIAALGHDFSVVKEERVEATCTEDGHEILYKCSRCDATQGGAVIAATGHNYSTGYFDWEGSFDNETKKVNAIFTCANCSDNQTVTVQASGSEKTPATCETVGTTTYSASASYEGKNIADTYDVADIPALGHAYGAPEWRWTDDGSSATAKFTCTRSGCAHVENVVAEGAAISSVVTTEPTCTTTGIRTFTAKVSFQGTEYVNAYEVVIPADGHTLVEHEAKAATCTEIGWDAYQTCSKCDYTTYSEIAALGHDLVHHDAQAATCEGIGWNAYDTCSRCDYSTYAEIPALGHDFAAEFTVDVEPTCTEVGSKSKHCSRCDATTEVTEIAAKGHAWNEGVVTTEPTCTTDGIKTYTCTVCGDTSKTEVVEKLGHDYNAVVTEPTCTEQGYTTHTCTRCSDAFVDTYVDALGHSYGAASWNWTGTSAAKATFTCETCGDEVVKDADVTSEQTTAPTCTTKGVTTHTATTTDPSGKTVTATTTSEIAATGHTEVVDAAVEATCTVTGLTEGKHCSVCNAVLVAQNVIPATGHSYVDTVTAPTCTTGGYTTHTCSVCGDSYTDSEVAATGHDYSAAAWNWTGTESATATFTCGTCGDAVVKNAAITSEDTTPATCTTKGVRTYTATTTDPSDKTVTSTTTSEIAALGHTDDGSTTCPVCGTEKTAFAVYSADDTSLNFYKRFEVPAADAQFCGKTATAVYTGIEEENSTLLSSEISLLAGDPVVVTEPDCLWQGYCSSIKTANIVDEGITPVTTTAWFKDCFSITSIEGLDKLDTSKVTDMSYMFRKCQELTSLDLSNFNTAKVTTMYSMFSNCSKLTSLDLSSFNTANVTTTQVMFFACSSLNTIYVGHEWSTTNMSYSPSMFSFCSNLPNFDSNTLDKTNAHTGEGGYLTCVGFKDGGAGHVYADGKCTLCGADEPKPTVLNVAWNGGPGMAGQALDISKVSAEMSYPDGSTKSLIGYTAGSPSYSTTGDNAWTNTDGIWASGGKGVANVMSNMSVSFALESAETLSFDWACSAEGSNYDYLYYSIYKDGSTTAMSGTGTSTKIANTSSSISSVDALSFTTVSTSLEAGSYEVVFTYRKDSSANTGLDQGFVKNLNVPNAKVFGVADGLTFSSETLSENMIVDDNFEVTVSYVEDAQTYSSVIRIPNVAALPLVDRLEAAATSRSLDSISWSELGTIADDLEAKTTTSVYYNAAVAAAEAGAYHTTTFDGKVVYATLIDVLKDEDTSGNSLGMTFMVTGGATSTANLMGSGNGVTTAVMNSSSTNSGGWGASEMRAALGTRGGSIAAKFADDLKSVVKNRAVAYGPTYNDTTDNVETSDDFMWLMSYAEVYGTMRSYYSGYPWLDMEGSQYLWFSQAGVTTSNYAALAGGSSYRWLRSCFPSYSGSFGAVGYGSGDPYNFSAIYSFAVCPCFSL